MIFKQHQFGPWVAVSVLLGVLVDVSGGMTSIQLIPQNPIIGGSVTLSVTGSTGIIRYFIWFKGLITYNDHIILTYIPGDKSPLSPGPLYNSRMTPLPDGSLQISNLNRMDEGNYTVKIHADNQSDTRVYLKIYDMVGKPNIMISTSLPKENDTVTLTCTSTNAEWIEWSRVPYGAMLSPDNRTVTFSRIKRSNSGDYRCQAGNPVTMENSDSITITVASTYHWRLNGTDIKKEQNELQVAQKVAEIEGTYTCVANNSLTQLTAMDSIYVNVTTESIDSTDQTSSNVTIAAGIGIVIAVLLLILVTVLAYLFAKHRQHKQQPDSTNNASSSPEGPVYENVQATQESHYEQLTHKDRAVYSTLASKAGKH